MAHLAHAQEERSQQEQSLPLRHVREELDEGGQHDGGPGDDGSLAQQRAGGGAASPQGGRQAEADASERGSSDRRGDAEQDHQGRVAGGVGLIDDCRKQVRDEHEVVHLEHERQWRLVCDGRDSFVMQGADESPLTCITCLSELSAKVPS